MRIKVERTHRFDCKVNKELFDAANAVRATTWPVLVERMLREVVAAKKVKKK